MAAARKAATAKPKSAGAARPRRSKKPAAKARFVPLTPEHFAPFDEARLVALADRVVSAAKTRRKTVLTQDEVGATLLSVCGDADHVITALTTVWGPGTEAATAGTTPPEPLELPAMIAPAEPLRRPVAA